jgi:hypothetical protein
MQSYKPDKTKIRGRIFNVCSHGDCGVHTIWDYSTCWSHLTNSEKSELKERVIKQSREKKEFRDTPLSGADLSNMDFSAIAGVP